MVIARSIEALLEAKKGYGGEIGFVPTMGALHGGHLALIQTARSQNDHLVVSVFVNPTQFLEGEDLDCYPRREEADSKICELAGVDILFMPTTDQMYEKDELTIGAPLRGGYILDGAKRPGHFDGMLQIVMKLLNVTTASRAYFGKKDAQQLFLISQMARTYFLPCQIIPCEIVRDNLGLALSSRNAYLSVDEKRRALSLSRSLKRATRMVMSGNLNAKEITEEMRDVLADTDKIEYIAIVDRNFKSIGEVKIADTIILVAAWVGQTRLIDNIWI
jgi:pantoate--beta-alanine ligase